MSQDLIDAGSGPIPNLEGKKIYLVSYPKIIFLYPTFVMALLAAFFTWLKPNMQPEDKHIIAGVFLGILAVNLIVFAFDFPRTTSLTIFFFAAAVVFGLLLLFRLREDLLPFITGLLIKYKPEANAVFYFSFAGVLAGLFLAVFVSVQFDYWEVTSNELLHHHGMLSNLERFAAPSLKIDKEINDVFEYMLLGSGRLILHPSDERRAIVLDNVLFISRKEQALTQLLGTLQVKVVPPS